MKVLFQSRKTLFSAPGGDTTQLLKTKEYLEKLGVEVDITLELEPDVKEYDIVHVFNLMRPQELYLQVRNAYRQGKKVALSTIYGPYVEFEKKARRGPLKYITKMLSMNQIDYCKVFARAILNREYSKGTLVYLLNGHRRLQKKILKMVDVFLPNSHSEMLRVANDFGLCNYKYVSVPNAVDISTFDYDKVEVEPEVEKYRDCILCVARIEGRKNQLNIIKACKGLPYQLVFIGKAGPNSQKYFQECLAEGGNTHFLGQVEHDRLPQFYKTARVHVLPSWMETPGLSSLEAAVMKTNIVATKKGDPEDYFGNFAYYCEPDDVESMRNAIVSAYNSEFDENLRKRVIDNYKWEDTAKETLKGYLMA